MKKSIVILLLMLVAGYVMAVPAKPGLVKVKMSDGTLVNARVVGDEYWHCVADESGNILAENGDGLYERSSRNLKNIDVQAMMMAGRRNKAVSRKPMSSSSISRAIVILVGFSDKPFTKTRTAFDNMMNEESGECNNANGSVREYFENSSFGAFVPQFDVYGPYTLSQTGAYYGGNSGGTDSNARQMIVDAVAAYIDENGENALQQYDCDEDGYVDNIFVFYAGHGENAGGGASCIWPHSSYVYPGWVEGRTEYGGVELGDYACTCELQGASGTTMSGIGPFCHEFSHVIGLPDLYDTWYSGHRTCSLWDVMDAGNYLNNEHTPPSYSSYERFYMGWLTPEILSEPDNITLEGLNNSNTAKIITSTEQHNLDGDDPDPTEFFMLEVRDGKGWDTHLPGKGMLITKVRYDETKWAWNEVNNYSDDLGVDIIEAGGVTGYYASASDAFPGSASVTSYTPYDGQPITDIRYLMDKVTFRYKGGREIFLVKFDGMGHGTPSSDEIKESVKDGGVVLPEVEDVDEDYEFVGWSESASASVADAGYSNENYYPEADIRLFAVYKHNGVIEPTENGCVTETFDNCRGKYDIGEKMDKYTDMPGWYGGCVKSDNGAVKMGSNTVRGSLITPNLHLSGDMTIEVLCKALMNTYLIVTAENGNTDSVEIGKEYQTVTLSLGAVPMDSRLTFTCGGNIFYIDSVQFCGAMKSPVEDVEAEQYILIRRSDRVTVMGLKGGETVRVMDMLGRVIGEGKAEDTEITFQTEGVLCVVQITDGANVTILK